MIRAESGPEFADDLFAELALDVARAKVEKFRCVGCAGAIETTLAELGSVRCHECR